MCFTAEIELHIENFNYKPPSSSSLALAAARTAARRHAAVLRRQHRQRPLVLDRGASSPSFSRRRRRRQQGGAADEPSLDTQWTTYVRDEGAINATSWWGGTFHSCSASSETSLAAGCASLPLPSPVRAHELTKARTRHRQRDHHLHRHQGLARGRLVRPRRSPSPLSLASRSSLSRSAPAHLDHLDRRNPRQSRFYCALLDEDQPWRWYSGSTLASPVGGKEGLNSTRCALSGLEDKQHTLVFGQRQEDVLGNGVTVRRLFLGPLPSPLSSRESVLQDLLRQALQLLTPALSSSTTTSSTMRPTPPSRS